MAGQTEGWRDRAAVMAEITFSNNLIILFQFQPLTKTNFMYRLAQH